jgi:hypothetical protein
VKIERAESKFEPVVITLESQKEVDCLLICLNTSHRVFEDNTSSLDKNIGRDRIEAAKGIYPNLYFQIEGLY